MASGVDNLFGFQLGTGIRYLDSEAQKTELSLEVAKIQFSMTGL